MLKQWFIKFLSLAVLGVSSVGYSCGDYCGDYGGFYDVGGYNLYTFAIDVSTYVDYSYTDMNWGGGCGSFSGSCGSTYNLGCDTSGIDLEIYNLSNQLNAYLYTNNLMNNGVYPPNAYGGYPSVDSTCILMGTCGLPGGNGFGNIPGPVFGYPPGFSTAGNPYPGLGVPTTPYPTSAPVSPFPINNFPAGNYPSTSAPRPWLSPVSGNPTIATPGINTGNNVPIPPSVRPPYAGCDNVAVLCPSGPITRNDDLKRPPVYQPVTTQTGSDPVRYRVPRGVVTH